jgi:hypothetical protein
MRISEYIASYTSGDRVPFREVLQEVKEFLVELVHFNWKGMNEEGQDTLHFFQLWLYWRFKIDGEVWKCTSYSTTKFINRVGIWRKLYAHAGLDPQISNFAGNYAKLPKVIKQLGKFGVSEAKATEAYNVIVLPTL